MKKVIFYFLAIILLGSQTCIAQKPKKNKTDKESYNLTGNVKSVKQNCYKTIKKKGIIVPGDSTGQSPANFTICYNKLGNKINCNSLYASDSTKADSVFKYDEKKRKTESQYKDPSGTLEAKIIYRYDDSGNNIEKKYYTSDGTLSKTSTLDNKGNIIEIEDYNTDESLNMKSTYTYDDNNNQIEEYHYDPDGTQKEKISYKYDEAGNLKESNSINVDGSTKWKLIYLYNQQNILISAKGYRSNGQLMLTNNFDTKGRDIEFEMYGLDGKVSSATSYEYEDDYQGNWIKKIISNNKVAKLIYIRKYEYYD